MGDSKTFGIPEAKGLKRCQGCVKLIASKVNYACPLTAGPESVHIPKMVLIMFL